MREYGAISPKFWIGETGRALRNNRDAQVLAMYLMTSPHSTMIGIFHCPILYMSTETGIPLEGAYKALASLVDLDFCTFDQDRDMLFVHNMAVWQVAESLKVDDKRRLGVIRQLNEIGHPYFKRAFLERYAEAFKIRELLDACPPSEPLARALVAPPKQLTGPGPGTGTVLGGLFGTEGDGNPDPPAPPKKDVARGSRIPDDWHPDETLLVWAKSERPGMDIPREIERFRDFWLAKAGADARKVDWGLTFKNWIRNSSNGQGGPRGGGQPQQSHSRAAGVPLE